MRLNNYFSHRSIWQCWLLSVFGSIIYPGSQYILKNGFRNLLITLKMPYVDLLPFSCILYARGTLKSLIGYYLFVPEPKLKTKGDRTLAVSDPWVWFPLPEEIRETEWPSSFKSHLKKYSYGKTFQVLISFQLSYFLKNVCNFYYDLSADYFYDLNALFPCSCEHCINKI